MIFEIILSVVIVIQTYVVINLMIKTEKLETFIENFENQLTQSIEEINEIEDNSDESEDEPNELIIDDETIQKARKSVERMAEIGR